MKGTIQQAKKYCQKELDLDETTPHYEFGNYADLILKTDRSKSSKLQIALDTYKTLKEF